MSEEWKPSEFISSRFSESHDLGDGYWIHKMNGVRFPDFPWLANKGVYPSGQTVNISLTKLGAKFSVWRDKRKMRNSRKWFRGWSR